MQLNAGESMRKLLKQSLAFTLFGALVFATSGCSQPYVRAYASEPYAQVAGTQEASAGQDAFVQADRSAAQPPTQAAQQTSEQVQQLVAPIALYPDPLVAQILAAATYPSEVVEAWRWMRQSGLKGIDLANAVDPQPWDPSVKALTQFPSVLDNMNKNLHWTSALGDAYVNQQDDVLNAVQVLRQRAQAAGSLQSTSQQTVTTQGQTIAIETADPQFVYVPAYDPWLVYGAPLAAYPGWVDVPGIYFAGPDLYFGFGVGLFAGFGWGWNDWGFDWHDRRMTYRHAPYFSHGRTFVNRHDVDQRGARFDHAPAPFDHTAAFRGGGPERTPAFHQQPGAQSQVGARSGAFSGFDHGGIARGYASRGRSSFGGGFPAGGFQGGGVHAAGGGFRGGGGGGGFRGGGGGGFHGGGGGGSHGGGGHR
jgi:hypothetical protein